MRHIIAWFSALARIEQSLFDAKLERKNIMTAIDDFKVVLEKYIADVNAAVTAFQTNVQAKVDAAVAAALAGDNTAIQALSAEVAAADLALPVAPTAVPITG
jgi:hypothetical protein